MFGVLSNQRRRQVLRYLLDESDETTLGDLAEHIASIENDKPERALTSTERKRVYICLYQCHLPKLDDADVIEFDQARKTVRPAEHTAEVLRVLPGTGGEDRDERAAKSSPLGRVAARLRSGFATLR